MAELDWREVKEIFHSALELDPARREPFLEKACRGNASLRAEVDSLLHADEDSMPWLDRAVFEAAAETLTREPAPNVEGRTIGPYKIVRRLGQGGMGTVYLATRADEEYQRRVAVKLVRQDLDREDIVRRFRQERQILASLDHPYIANLLDGGITEEGLPYFIMEYVEGVPVDRYCDENRLSLEARIELFRQICSAVHYAHRHLVVHCDLKPSNILVTSDGVPKLLDFGIARLLSTEHVPQVVTMPMVDSRLLTPEYASPEQVRDERLTTASDVYSLGVLLYRLLTGKLPFRFNRRVLWEIERVICIEEPTRPSDAIVPRYHEFDDRAWETTGEAEEGSLVWQGSPEKVRRRLAGDLDNIVLMAMRKDPARRYGSAGQLSDDLRRYMARMPVVARKDTLPYRMGKFIRRNRVWVAAAALVVLSLMLGIVATTRLYLVAKSQRAEAERQRRTAEQVSSFLGDLFEEMDLYKDQGSGFQVRGFLDDASRRIDQELAGQDEVRARMKNIIGVAYYRFAHLDKSASLLDDALQTHRRLYGEDSPEYAESLRGQCGLRRTQREYDEAESLCRQSLEIQTRLLGQEHPEVAETLRLLALVLHNKGSFEDALSTYRRALDLTLRVSPDQHRAVAVTLHSLGVVLYDQGNSDEAETYLRKAVSLYREHLGEEDLSLAAGLNTLAVVLKNKGDYEEAEEHYRKALEIREMVLGKHHPIIVTSLLNLGSLKHAQGNYRDAESFYRDALDLVEEHPDGPHPERANTLHLWGRTKQTLGDHLEAAKLIGESLAVRRQHLPANHPAIAQGLIDLGLIQIELGLASQAEVNLRDGLRIREEKFSRDHWLTAAARSALGESLTELRRFEEAEPLILESYRTLLSRRGEAHRLTQAALKRVIKLYEAWPKPAKAAEFRSMQKDPNP